MFYQINGKLYTKVGGRYNEVIVKLSPENKIIFVPTNNILSMNDVGRDYLMVTIDTIRDNFIKNKI